MENFTYKWFPKCEFNGKADPVKVANEMNELGENVVPEQILEAARDEETELHKCFEWNDTVAAEKYRLHQAKKIPEMLHIVYLDGKKEEDEKPKEFRVYYHEPSMPGYTQTKVIFKQEDRYELLLKQAKYELRCFKNKYAMLKELKPIFDLID